MDPDSIIRGGGAGWGQGGVKMLEAQRHFRPSGLISLARYRGGGGADLPGTSPGSATQCYQLNFIS